MNRRSFVKKSAIAGVTGIMMPSVLCDKVVERNLGFTYEFCTLIYGKVDKEKVKQYCESIINTIYERDCYGRMIHKKNKKWEYLGSEIADDKENQQFIVTRRFRKL